MRINAGLLDMAPPTEVMNSHYRKGGLNIEILVKFHWLIQLSIICDEFYTHGSKMKDKVYVKPL